MRTTARLHIQRRRVSPELFSALTRRWPLAARSVTFYLEVEAGSEEFSDVIRVIREHGLEPPDRFPPRQPRAPFTLTFERCYRHEDFLAAPFLWFRAEEIPDRPVRSEDGFIVLDDDGRRASGAIRCPDGGSTADLVVPVEVRKQLEASGLQRLVFRPVRSPDGQFINEWVELTSEVTMPPLAPSMELGNGPQGYWVIPREGLYVPPELRYRREDVAEMPAVDIAVTHERMFHSFPSSHPKVVSRRFYGVCHDHGWETNWVPVRVE